MMAWAAAGARTLPSWMMKANTSRGVFGAAWPLSMIGKPSGVSPAAQDFSRAAQASSSTGS